MGPLKKMNNPLSRACALEPLQMLPKKTQRIYFLPSGRFVSSNTLKLCLQIISSIAQHQADAVFADVDSKHRDQITEW